MMKRVVIVGAAGRDFHDFNTVFRGREDVEVVAFTAAESQNLGEVGEQERYYPSSLAGKGYPDGIPIRPESELEEIVSSEDVDEVVFSYSDVSHEKVMHIASRAISAGADFRIIGQEMMLKADLPVVAVDAVRTGCGKSQLSRKLAATLQDMGLEVAVVREPMPYGDLEEQRVQRFETMEDLDEKKVTVEEREEYEQHIKRGHTVFAGVDYIGILDQVEEGFDVLVWDGGNNELPFYRPDLHFVLNDALRPGAADRYHPGEANLRMADYAVVNKENSATSEQLEEVMDTIEKVNPEVEVVHADSILKSEREKIKGKRVLAVEDGPTLTHGDMPEGAAAPAARKYGAAELVDPREAAVGSIKNVFENYPHLGDVLPAMGYSDEQLEELEQTIRNVDCDIVLAGTPIDLSRLVDTDKPVVDVEYYIELKDFDLEKVLKEELSL